MGIRARLVGSYLAVILVTVAILEILLIVSVRNYYYRNVERILVNQADISASFFGQYFTAEDLESQSERLLIGFSNESAAQVQIVDRSGRLIQDSAGVRSDRMMIDYPDVRGALDGQAEVWRGREPSTAETVMAVSYPLRQNGVTVGAVRYVTSLTDTKETVNLIAALSLAAGLIVVAIVTVLGFLLSRTITSAVTDLKLAAEQMSDGDLSARAKKRYRDELGTLADTFNAMAAKIQRNEGMKNDFISSVSHELRTPLTSIKGWAVTLKDGNASDKTLLAEGMDIIEKETDRLTRLVDDLLDFSKWDNGRMELRPVSIRLPKLLRQIGMQLSPRAERLGISLVVEIEEPLPEVLVDGNRLKQVLINLLDNSLKFTPRFGTVRLTARPGQDQVVIAVEDNGAGIAEQDLAEVFRKFYKGNPNGSGSGLGLPISEQIIKLHGGRMRIESREGEGTKVEVLLPAPGQI